MADIETSKDITIIPKILGVAGFGSGVVGFGYTVLKYTETNGLNTNAFNQQGLDYYKELVREYKDVEADIHKNTLEIHKLKKDLQATEDLFFKLL